MSGSQLKTAIYLLLLSAAQMYHGAYHGFADSLSHIWIHLMPEMTSLAAKSWRSQRFTLKIYKHKIYVFSVPFYPNDITTVEWADRKILPGTFWCPNIRTLLLILFWEASFFKKSMPSYHECGPLSLHIWTEFPSMSVQSSALQLKIKNPEIDFMFVERPSLKNADSRCMFYKGGRAIWYSIEKHQHMHHGLLRRTAVVSLRTPVLWSDQPWADPLLSWRFQSRRNEAYMWPVSR
jgi:hypothetical protein